MLIFCEGFQDGAISATITLVSGEQVNNKGEAKVAGLCFRFRNRHEYYFAGIGAFGSKFFIAKYINGSTQGIASTGSSSMLSKDDLYHLEIKCEGSLITLLENGVEHLRTCK